MVAAITALLDVTIGVEQGILLAIALSLPDHIRRSYHPRTPCWSSMIRVGGRTVPSPEEASPATDAEPGLVICRFGATLYYANANRFTEEIRSLLDRPDGASAWVRIDCAAIADIDYSGGESLFDLLDEMKEKRSRLLLAELDEGVRDELDRYGFSDAIGADAIFDTVAAAAVAFGSRDRPAT